MYYAFRVLLITLLFHSFSSFSQEQRSSVSLTGYYVDFDDYLSGMGFSVGYQYKLNDYLVIEGNLAHVRGDSFPDDYYYNTTDTTPTADVWYTKTSMINAGVNLHLTFINGTHNYFSFYAGIGCIWLDGTDFMKATIPVLVNGQEVNVVSADLLSEKTSYVSRSLGLQYKYKFSNGFQFGADLNITQTFKGENNYILPDNYRAIGLTISKSF